MSKFDDATLDQMFKLFGEDQINEVINSDLSYYQDKPVEFLTEKLGVENLYDDIITVANSVSKNKITVAMSANGTGKTFLAAQLACWYYLCFPNSQVICACAPPEENLKQGLFSEISNIFYKHKNTLFRGHELTALAIKPKINSKDLKEGDEVDTKHFLVGRAIPSGGGPAKVKSAFSGRHHKSQLYLIDEADGCPDEIFEAVDGCLSGSHVRLLCMFNPRVRSGYMYKLTSGNNSNRLANKVNLSAFSHPNVVSGEEIIPGAVSRDKTIQRIWECSRELKEIEEPDNDCFEIPAYLEGAIAETAGGGDFPPLPGGWRKITVPAFSTLVLGTYPSSSQNSLFDEIDINNAISRWKMYKAQYGDSATEGLKCLLGVDVADMGGDETVVAKRYGNFISGFDSWSGIDLDKSADHIAQIYADLDAYQCNVESDGIGAAIPPKISSMYYWRCENKECEGLSKTYLDTSISKCPICHLDMVRCHFNVRKIYVSSPSQKKCEYGRFHLLRDELAWAFAEWLKKEPMAMLPDDEELRKQMLAFDFFEDSNSGKIKVSDKKTVRKRLEGRSPDKFAAVVQTFYSPPIPRIRMI